MRLLRSIVCRCTRRRRAGGAAAQSFRLACVQTTWIRLEIRSNLWHSIREPRVGKLWDISLTASAESQAKSCAICPSMISAFLRSWNLSITLPFLQVGSNKLTPISRHRAWHSIPDQEWIGLLWRSHLLVKIPSLNLLRTLGCWSFGDRPRHRHSGANTESSHIGRMRWSSASLLSANC